MLQEKKAPNPEYMPPEPPQGLNPLQVHQYYMQMADYHDKNAWKHSRIGGLQKLWSQGKAYHDDRHQFHKAMRDGFAQKALAVDLSQSSEGQQKSGFGGMRESIEDVDEGIAGLGGQEIAMIASMIAAPWAISKVSKGLGHAGKVLGQAVKGVKDTPGAFKKGAEGSSSGTSALGRLGTSLGQKVKSATSATVSGVKTVASKGLLGAASDAFRKEEAFGGTTPTGALNTVINNKAPNLKLLQPKAPTAAKPVAVKNTTTIKPSDQKMAGVRKAVEAVASGRRSLDEGALTILYDFYNPWNGINNAVGVCSSCGGSSVRAGTCQNCSRRY